jgi:hypothetical protein
MQPKRRKNKSEYGLMDGKLFSRYIYKFTNVLSCHCVCGSELHATPWCLTWIQGWLETRCQTCHNLKVKNLCRLLIFMDIGNRLIFHENVCTLSEWKWVSLNINSYN